MHNEKGFAISSVIYAILVLFLLIMLGLLGILGSRKLVFDKFKTDVMNKLNGVETTNYGDKSGANSPEILDGMIPIKYENNNWVYADITKKWYDYNEKEWANAIVLNSGVNKKVGDIINESDIALWYVWIPRYKYQLFNVNNGSVNEQEINISFEIGTKTTGTVNCVTNTNPSGMNTSESCTHVQVGNWYTHPAFTFGDQELRGFWIGKFEVSTTDSACNTTPNATNCNKATTVTIKPNVSSWRYTTVSNFYTSIQNIKTTYNLTSYDSHMLKNMEWGAVAYLSYSKYGQGNTEVYINNSSGYYTGRSGGNIGGSTNIVATQYPSSGSTSTDIYYNYGYYTYDGKVVNYDGTIGNYASDRTLGTKASTTGNIYGVYDMSGGTFEYVVGNMVNSSNAFYSSDAGFTSTPDNKYYDAYTYNTSYTTHGRGKLGDATKEILKTFGSDTGGWNGDYAYFPGSTYSWLRRGGFYYGGANSGVFSFNSYTGTADDYNSSRAVLTRK